MINFEGPPVITGIRVMGLSHRLLGSNRVAHAKARIVCTTLTEATISGPENPHRSLSMFADQIFYVKISHLISWRRVAKSGESHVIFQTDKIR